MFSRGNSIKSREISFICCNEVIDTLADAPLFRSGFPVQLGFRQTAKGLLNPVGGLPDAAYEFRYFRFLIQFSLIF
jgi:hypothetical protein